MFEVLILVGGLAVGVVVLGMLAVKTVALFFKASFWALALPFKIIAALVGALFSVLLAVIVPILVVCGIVGMVLTVPLLVLFAIPCILIGLGVCLIANVVL